LFAYIVKLFQRVFQKLDFQIFIEKNTLLANNGHLLFAK